MALPPELLAMVLARVRLSDLANLRLVSSVFLCNPALYVTVLSSPGVQEAERDGGWSWRQDTVDHSISGGPDCRFTQPTTHREVQLYTIQNNRSF